MLGEWGDDKSADDRTTAALEFRVVDGAPQFMVIDAGERPVSKSKLANAALSREDVIGTPIAQTVFAISDAVYMTEGVKELRSWSDAA